MTRRFDHVFFDATDTLLRVRGSVGAVYAPVAARHGLQATPVEIDRAFRAAIASAPPAAFPEARTDEIPALERRWWRDVVQRTFEPFGAFPRFAAFFDEVFELFRGTAAWELLPGARETLAALAVQGRRLGIVSEMDGRLHDALAAFQLDSLFDAVALSTREGAVKRDGGLFHRALELARASPARSAHAGDSLESDVEGARAAGLTAIYFDGRGRGDAPPGTSVVSRLTEIPSLLQRLEE
jgi:putative hydrolase of the HAD superfamily